MTSFACPHGFVGSCRACASEQEAQEVGAAIGAEAARTVAAVLTPPLQALRAERDHLAAIVRELAEDCGPPLHPDYGDCAWCEDSYEDMTGKEASDHQDSCTWRKACEWAAAHPVKTDALRAGWVSARRQALTVQEGE